MLIEPDIIQQLLSAFNTLVARDDNMSRVKCYAYEEIINKKLCRKEI